MRPFYSLVRAIEKDVGEENKLITKLKRVFRKLPHRYKGLLHCERCFNKGMKRAWKSNNCVVNTNEIDLSKYWKFNQRNNMKKKYEAINGKEYTEKEYIAYLEGIAWGIWRMEVELGDGDWHCKSYDPLYIQGLGRVGSYVFDFHDGGRWHSFDSYEQIYEGLMNQIKESKKYIEELRSERKK